MPIQRLDNCQFCSMEVFFIVSQQTPKTLPIFPRTDKSGISISRNFRFTAFVGCRILVTDLLFVKGTAFPKIREMGTTRVVSNNAREYCRNDGNDWFVFNLSRKMSNKGLVFSFLPNRFPWKYNRLYTNMEI